MLGTVWVPSSCYIKNLIIKTVSQWLFSMAGMRGGVGGWGGRNLSHQIWRGKWKMLGSLGVRCLFGAAERQVSLFLAVLSYHWSWWDLHFFRCLHFYFFFRVTILQHLEGRGIFTGAISYLELNLGTEKTGGKKNPKNHHYQKLRSVLQKLWKAPKDSELI